MLRLNVLTWIVASCVAAVKIEPGGGPIIVGGESARIEDVPYQLAMISGDRHICGATIISEVYALTAAHCTEGRDAKTMSVRAGSIYTGKDGVIHRVVEKIEHEKFKLPDYDIAILKVEPPFVFTKKIKAVRLASVTPAVGTPTTVSGWGYTSFENRTEPEDLQKVKVFISDHAECVRVYNENNGIYKVNERMLCAMVPGGGKDFCSGDSGGPLEANHELVGIVSWSASCALPKFPGVYTDVAFFRDFIKKHTGI